MSPRVLLSVLLLLSASATADDLDPRMAELWTLLGFELEDDGGDGERPWLGVGVEDSADPAGVRLTTVTPESPAAAAGLAPGDVLLEFSGRPLSGEGSDLAPSQRLVAEVGAAKVGDTVRVALRRGEERLELEIRLSARPRSEPIFRPHPELPAPVAAPDWAGTCLDEEGRRVLSEIARTTTYRSDGGAFGGTSDPFRLSEVDTLLERPLLAPHVVRGLAGEVRAAALPAPDLAGLVAILAGWLDAPVERPAPEPAPAKLSEFLERLEARFEESRKARDTALAALSQEDRAFLVETAGSILVGSLSLEESRRFLSLAAKIGPALPALFGEAARTAALVASLDPESLEVDLPAVEGEHAGVDGPVLYDREWEGIGRVVVGGVASNRYAGEFAVVIDLAGDDLYAGVCGKAGRDSILLDLGGDDTYRSASRGQAHAVLAASFLVDWSGDDLYEGENEVQGVGVLGTGVLADLAGDDRYSADRAAQGAGLLGIGLLLDGAGLDRYAAYQFAQGFAFVHGAGAVVELSGSDVYVACGKYEDFREPGLATASLSQGFGFGLRPWEDRTFGGSGGLGAIFDFAGHDLYHGDYFAQGSSYWYALGVLYDEAGRDRYVANRYSQGAGIHLSVGVLLDAEGDDHYAAPAVGVSQGCGHDLAAGFLVDLAGNDAYVSGTLSQGAGNDNGLGVLVDLSGDDLYQARSQSQGHGTMSPGRGYGSLGVLLDRAGADRYDLGGADGEEVKRERWGYCLDR